MRQVAFVLSNDSSIRRIILHKTQNGVYLYLSPTFADSEVSYDQWHMNISEAKLVAEEHYGISQQKWLTIPDAEPNEAFKLGSISVRVRKDDMNNPSTIDILIGNKWTQY